MIDLIRGKYSEVPFYVILPDGSRALCKGGYLISDNGFMTVAQIMDPIKHRWTEQHLIWSEWIESIRRMSNVHLVS